MLKFLLGTAEQKKADEIYRLSEADAKNGDSVFILVPEQYSMYSELELIKRLGLSSQNKIQIITFSRLVNMIFSKLGPLRTKYIDKAGKYFLTCRAMQLVKEDLSVFAKNASQSGFGGLIVSLISEFKRYGITPEMLSQYSKKTEGGLLSLKLSDLALIYKKFDELLKESWQNAEDNLLIALDKIPDADFLSGKLYINFFRSFTPLEYEVIAALMKKMDVTISLCTDTVSDDSSLFSSQVYSYKKLLKIAHELKINHEDPVFFEEDSSCVPEEITHLKNNYFEPLPQTFDGELSAVHIVRPQNRYKEVERTARLIKKLCRTKGYRFNDFLILTGDMESYESLIPPIFEEFSINFFMDQKVRLTESPFIRMITSLLEILAFGFSYERIMTILRSGFWDIDPLDTDIFENYILAADITLKQWFIKDGFTYNPYSSFDIDKINDIKGKTINRILKLLDMLRGKKDVSLICSIFLKWLKELNIENTVSAKIQTFNQAGDIESSEKLSHTFNSFVSLINQMSDCMCDTKVTMVEFYEIFCSSLKELSVGIVPPTKDQVLVSEIDHFRSVGQKVVIVIGVLDKVFPKSYDSEGILSDADRKSLLEIGLTLSPDCYTKQKEDLFLIYSVFDTAKEELYLFSPVSDKEGKSLGSSEVLKRIKSSIFPALKDEAPETELDMVEGQLYTFYELCAKLFECGFDPENLSPLQKSVYECFKKDPDFSERLQFFKEMYQAESEPSAISKAMAKKLYGSPLSLSVSKLEKYNSCAFSFFMKYGLFAEERLWGGLKATDTGTILHDILCRYFKDKSDKKADFKEIRREDCFSEISYLVNDFAKSSQNTLFVSSNYYAYMLMRLKDIASSTAWKLVKFYSTSAFKPSGFEIGFGKKGELPPYEIETKDGKAFLSGFIDKVDSALINGREYITVTDYKSSEKRLNPDMIDAGITIQPLIYMNAIAADDEAKKPAATMYFEMTDPILKCETAPTDDEWEQGLSDNIKVHGLFLDEPEFLNAFDPAMDDKNAPHYIPCDKKSRLIDELFKKRLLDAEKCAITAAEKIADGIIDENPPKIAGFNPCDWCDYKTVCSKR